MSRENHEGKPIPEEPILTTLALGEEGDPDPCPPVWEPGEPVATTMAIGEEGDPDPDPCFPVCEPVATTMAVGEEGDPDMDLWSA